ncbi:MAG: hypothetical protein OXF06_06595 [Bacteroidetes bacterium]|nr:hypothetical protein [Bacteroidota bacterium]
MSSVIEWVDEQAPSESMQETDTTADVSDVTVSPITDESMPKDF